ncbi:hypothetical protein TNCV_4654341 [Trichonephila clavipes]|nr:hypothetical protein TNCV_4654341 [Trichonephila clavipes]
MCVRLPPIPVTTERLKTYNVHPDIGAHGARDGMCRDRRGRQRDNRSKELRPTRSWMGGERVDIRDRGGRESEREDCDLEGAVVKPLAAIGIEILLDRAVVMRAPPAKRLDF